MATMLLRRSFIMLAAWAILPAAPAIALDSSKGVTGANHLRAARYATGAGVEVGIIDTVFYGILPLNHLGGRLTAQYDFRGKTSGQSPDPLLNPFDDHETLVADVIAGDDSVYSGVAPGATIVDAAIDDVTFETRRAASAWLSANRGTRLLNLSAGFGANANGSGAETLYWDWFMRSKDALLIAAAGNTFGQVTVPADSFNGIAVGAMNDATLTRWDGSAYQLNGGAAGTEVRGKPDILAPGVNIVDGLSFNNHPELGTSFAAPHVVGTAALLTDYGNLHPTADTLDHRGIKAIILNSARKRHITTPETFSTTSLDSAAPNASYDKDYLVCTSSCTIGDAATAGLTQSWTPAGWSYSGAKLTVAKPLDDEQGVGFLDADRAIINLAGGNYGPGAVAGIGWDQSTISPDDPPAAHTYALQQTLAAGSFLTATLTWDRVVSELDGDGVVEVGDTYSFGELANLDLRVLNGSDQIIAESVSTTDNVEHLHFPLPTNGNPGDFKLQLVYNGGGMLATDYALAWWTDPTPLVPGDYNLDGTVNALDYDVWRTGFSTSTATSPLIRADGDGNGIVDAADYVLWRDHLGQSWLPGAGAAVPEPSSMVISLLLFVGAVTFRRRSTANPLFDL
jgi:Subtilase family/Dockerin type I domain